MAPAAVNHFYEGRNVVHVQDIHFSGVLSSKTYLRYYAGMKISMYQPKTICIISERMSSTVIVCFDSLIATIGYAYDHNTNKYLPGKFGSPE